MPDRLVHAGDEDEKGEAPTATDRGALISKRIDDSYVVDTTGRTRLPWQYILMLIAVVLLIVLPFVVTPESEGVEFVFFMAYSMLGLLFVMSFAILHQVPREVVRVYENGVEVRSWRGEVTFIPWGLFDSGFIKEKAGSRRMRLNGFLGVATIEDTMPHFDDFVEDVEERAGKKRYRFVEPETAPERHALKGRYATTGLTMYAVGSTIAIAMAYTLFFDFSESVLPLMVILGFVYIALNVIPAMAKWFLNANRAFFIGVDRRSAATLFTVVLVVLYSVFLYGFVSAIPDVMRHDEGIHETLEPGATTIEPGDYTDQTLTATGPVTVRDGETLRLVNCTLEFDPAPGHKWGLWVAEGGSLYMEGTLVKSVDNGVGYNIELHGKAWILNSTIDGVSTAEDVWSEEKGKLLMDYGFEIYSDDVVIDGTRIVESIDTGMLTYDCSPTLNNVTYLKSGRTSLIILLCSPVVTNCIFDGSYRGVRATDATLDIRDCTFIGNNYGAELEWCDGNVTGNLFEANKWGSLTTIGSDLMLEGNTYVANGEGETHWSVIDPIYGMMYFMWLIFPIMVLSISVKDLYNGFRDEEGVAR